MMHALRYKNHTTNESGYGLFVITNDPELEIETVNCIRKEKTIEGLAKTVAQDWEKVVQEAKCDNIYLGYAHNLPELQMKRITGENVARFEVMDYFNPSSEQKSSFYSILIKASKKLAPCLAKKASPGKPKKNDIGVPPPDC